MLKGSEDSGVRGEGATSSRLRCIRPINGPWHHHTRSPIQQRQADMVRITAMVVSALCGLCAPQCSDDDDDCASELLNHRMIILGESAGMMMMLIMMMMIIMMMMMIVMILVIERV